MQYASAGVHLPRLVLVTGHGHPRAAAGAIPPTPQMKWRLNLKSRLLVMVPVR